MTVIKINYLGIIFYFKIFFLFNYNIMATTSFAAQNAFVFASYNRENRNISLGLKLAAVNTLKPEFKELVASVYYNDQVEHKVFSRLFISGIISKTPTALDFTLDMSFENSGFVGLVEIKEFYALPGDATVTESSLGTKPTAFLARPAAPQISPLNKGTISNSATAGKLDLSNVSFRIALDGNNGGNPFAAYTAFFIVNNNGIVSGPTMIGTANTAITAADLLAGFVDVSIGTAITALTPASKLSIRVTLDNGKDESLASEALVIEVSNKPAAAILLEVRSGEQSGNANKLKTIIKGKLADNFDEKPWTHIEAQISKDNGSNWVRGVALTKAQVLSQMNEKGSFSITVDNVLTNADALLPGLVTRLVTGQSATPSINLVVAPNEGSSESRKFLANVDKSTPATAALAIAYNSANKEYTFTVTGTDGAAVSSESVSVIELSKNDDPVKRLVSSVAAGFAASVAAAFSLPEADVKSSDVFSVRFRKQSNLTPLLVSRHESPSPLVDSLSGRPVLIHAVASSLPVALPLKEDEVPVPLQLVVSEVTTGAGAGLRSLVLSSVTPQLRPDYVYGSTEIQVSTKNDFSSLLRLASNGGATLSTPAVDGDLSENIVISRFSDSGSSPYSQITFGSNLLVFIRMRNVVSSNGASLNSKWSVIEHVTSPATAPAALASLVSARNDSKSAVLTVAKAVKDRTFAGFVGSQNCSAVEYRVITCDRDGNIVDNKVIPFDDSVVTDFKVFVDLLPGQKYTFKARVLYKNITGESILSDETRTDFEFIKAPVVRKVEVDETDTTVTIRAVVDKFNALSAPAVTAIVPHQDVNGNPQLVAQMTFLNGVYTVGPLTKSSLKPLNSNSNQPELAVLVNTDGGFAFGVWP
jgi:hypothetical protein